MSHPRLDVSVALGERSYQIAITAGGLPQLPAQLQQHCPCSHVVLITDSQVLPLYAQGLARTLAEQGYRVDLFAIPHGESSKSVAQLESLWNQMLAARTDRKSVVVAVGGGVVGDLAGFAAASFTRGLRFVQVPTTLLAQVDSSVGGKVGINLPTAKNMVGAFWQPAFVWIDTETLQTLPVREYRAGLAEVVKYGVIQDASFFAYLASQVPAIQGRDPEVLKTIVARCCRLKADVVENDERETTGLRAILNYGHTFAHALEAILDYGTLLHGEAVSIGMMCAARLAHRLGRIPAEVVEQQRQLLASLELPLSVPPVDLAALIGFMQHDKKVEHGRLRFVLPCRLGHVELVDDVPEALVQEALTE